jgi:2-polyprenyl-6-methoxyphenol hydroxylase-like FAD-dependent oxidoreductase
MRALIVGAGIGGLTAAAALYRAGIDAAVFERAPALGEVGAGISLWPNAVRALDALGVGAAVRAAGVSSYRGGIHTRRGRLLAAADAEDLARVFGAPMLILHRARLLQVLHDAVDPRQVRLGTAATGYRQDADGVSLLLGDGGVERGDVLIGADGIRSAVRAQLFPDVRPRFAGQRAWRGVVRFAPPPGAAFWGESWGAGTRFGLLPMVDGHVYWYAARNAAESEPPPDGGDRAELLRIFASWHPPIPELVATTPESAILRNDLYDLAPMASWTDRRVALLGDAAHATTPNLGQGGCQAIEDALVLARSLALASDPAAGLRAYAAERMARANRIIVLSRRAGEIGNWEHPVACAVRNALTWLTPRAVRMRTLRSIVGDAA